MDERSREACPVCNQHTLHLVHLPQIGPTGARQYDDLFGFGDVKSEQPPGIACWTCGAEWPSLEAFRAAQAGEAAPPEEDEPPA